MKITNLDIRGFRAFSGEHTFDLDADVVLFTGANGRGKTSVFDAILWALTGSVPRIEKQSEDTPLISLYSESGQARVALGLLDEEGTGVEIVRSDDSKNSRVSVKVDGVEFKGESATHWILNEIWPNAQTAEKASSAFSKALTRSVYLQQDLVRQFVEADDEKERFSAVSELVGSGRFSDLNKALDTQRKSWKRQTGKIEGRIREARENLESLKGQREELGEPEEESFNELKEAWKAWWRRTHKLGVQREAPELDDSSASSALDEAVSALRTLRRKARRRHSDASDLLEDVQDHPSEDELPDLDSLQDALTRAREEKEEAKKALDDAREAAAHQREEQLIEREEAEELATLARLAMRHIDGPCPVCQQEHSIETTRRHLRALIEQVSELGTGDVASDASERVQKALSRLEKKEEAVAKAEEALKHAQTVHRKAKQRQGALREWLEDLNVSYHSSEDLEDVIRRKQENLDERADTIQAHVESGEQLSLRLATVAQESRRKELNHEIEELEQKLEELKSRVQSRNSASKLADKMVEELEVATKDYVTERLDRVSSLLQKIYARVDPHPTFRVIRLMTNFSYRRGRLNPYVGDPSSDFGDQEPFSVMSSSQVNVVALSIFLALNLGIPTIPLKTVMLDDPLQSLDDINLLGLIDLIRRARAHRQIFLSTHDSRLSGLLKRKLRPIDMSQRTRAYSFVDWTREGPEIEAFDVERDKRPMRLVAA